jgi:vitamin B12 transporter
MPSPALSHPIAFLAACAFLPGTLAASAPAAEETDQVFPLDTLVISATRTPQEASSLLASVSAPSLSSLEDAQVRNLSGALDTLPGVSVATSGGAGGPASLFMRGASSHQVLFFVDGVRMNDRSTAYFNFLGGADLAGLDRLEVLRGPQSTLYGSSAMGGVILMESRRGRGETAGSLSANVGSFGTYGGSALVHGTSGAIDFAGSLTRWMTQNDRPQNDFDQWSGSARLEAKVTETLRVGTTLRAQRGDYQEPGSRFFAFPGRVESDNALATAFAEWITDDEDVVTRLTYGRHERDYSFADSFGTSDSHNRRDVVDWQTAWKASPALELVGGVNAEWSRYTISGWRTTDRVLAGYLSATTHVAEKFILNAGVRHDDYHSAGAATTGRAGAAWLLSEKRTKLRVTMGTGFTAPGSDDRFGVPQWGQLGNPGLRPEKSTGWDAGIDQTFADERLTTSATYFENRFRDLFDYDFNPTTFAGQVVNRDRATTRGVELSAQARLHERVQLRGSYTWLDAFDRDTHARLIRRPRHVADLDARVQAARGILVGLGAHLVANRLDNTPTGTARIEDYTTLRAYVSCAVREDVTLRLRIENALDRQYDEVAGYAALPRAVHGSVEWRF